MLHNQQTPTVSTKDRTISKKDLPNESTCWGTSSPLSTPSASPPQQPPPPPNRGTPISESTIRSTSQSTSTNFPVSTPVHTDTIATLQFSKQGSTLPLGRGVRETKSKNGRSRPRKPFISRVFCARRGVETMVSDHGLGRGQTMVSE